MGNIGPCITTSSRPLAAPRLNPRDRSIVTAATLIAEDKISLISEEFPRALNVAGILGQATMKGPRTYLCISGSIALANAAMTASSSCPSISLGARPKSA